MRAKAPALPARPALKRRIKDADTSDTMFKQMGTQPPFEIS